MPKLSTTLAWTALFKVLTSATVLLLLTSPWGRTQESASWASAVSVDEAFSASHQALNATASDILASAQRPLPVECSADPLPSSGLSKPDEEGQIVRSLQLQQAVERIQKLRPIFEPMLREEGVPQQLSAVVLVESGGLVFYADSGSSYGGGPALGQV